MKTVVLSLLTLLVLLNPISASGLTLTGESKTYFQFRETFDSTKLAPIYEYLDFSIRETKIENISFHFGGWVGYKNKENDGFAKKYDNDLQYAYMSIRRATGNTVLNVGRIYVSEGVAMENVDGAYAATDLKGGFRAIVFGGVPIETDFDNRAGDIIYGGRFTHSIPSAYTIGVSYLKENRGNTDLREETGIDLWLQPVKNVQVLGRSSYDLNNSGWMEHSYRAAFGPFANFRITPQVSWIDYKHFFTASTSGAFALQKGVIDPNEEAFILGGDIDYTLNRNLIVRADYRHFNYDIAGNAHYYGAGINYSMPQMGGAGVFFHRMAGDNNRLRYNEFRVYATKKLGKADVTVDFFDVLYDNEINGIKNSYAAVAAVGYRITNSVRVAADIEYARNPFFKKEVKAFLKLVYRFGYESRKKGV